MNDKKFYKGAIEVIDSYSVCDFHVKKHISIAALGFLDERELKEFVKELEKAVKHFRAVK